MKNMTKLIAPILVFAVAAGVGGCSSCTTSRELKKFPTIEIVSPANNFALTRTNDTDGDFTNGLQMEIKISATSLKEGERVVLTAVSDSDASVKAQVAGELTLVEGESDVLEVTFAGFTPPVGDVTITAKYTFSASAFIEKSINITVERIDLPTLSIISPQDSARLTAADDNDGDLFNGFTTDVTIATQNVEAGQVVQLFIDDASVGNRPVGESGAVTFENVVLAESPEPPGIKIEAKTTNQVGDAAEAVIRVLVDTGRCIVRLSPAPVAQGCDFASGSDLSPDDPTWVEREFTVESNCEEVQLTLNGTLHGTPKALVDGTVTFQVPLEQADGIEGQYDPRASNEIRVTAAASDGRFGSTPPAFYVADTITPTLTVTAPEGNGNDGVLISIDDLDDDTDGLQFDVTGTICAAPGDTVVSVALTDAEGAAVGDAVNAAVLPDLVDGCRAWRVSGMTITLPGTMTLTATASDSCGNEGSGEAGFVADFVVPSLSIAGPGDDTTFLAGDDVDRDADNGFQIDVLVDSTDLDEGDIIILEVASVGDNGELLPFDTFDDEEGVAGFSGAVGAGDDPVRTTIRLTLTPGSHRFRARYRGANPARSPELGVGVRVVLTTPTIALVGVPARTGAATIQVCATTTNVTPGQPVTLSLNGEALPGTVAVTPDLGACFADVALVDGANTLRARVADDAGQEAVSEEVLVFADRAAPTIAFIRPAPGALDLVEGDDQDEDLSNGFQYNVQVQILDDDPALTLTLLARGSTYRDPAADANNHTFANVDLGPGENTIGVTAVDSVGNSAQLEIVVNVEIDAPEVNFAFPADGDCFSDGSNVEVVLTTDADDGSDAFVTVNAQDSLPRPTRDGRATFNLFLPDNQDSTLRGRVEAGVGAPGFSATLTVTVKSNAPTLAFVDPPADQPINEASADDGPGIAGFQEDVVVNAGELSPGQQATLTVDCGDGPAAYGPVGVSDGAFRFADVEIPEDWEGECVGVATTTDCASNETVKQVTWTVDRVPPAIRFDNLEDGTRLTSAHDSNPVADGIQQTIICQVDGVAEGALVTLTVGNLQPVSRAAPETGRVVFAGVDMPNGDAVVVRCSATDPAGNEGSEQVTITVVADQIELIWIHPADAAVVWGVVADTAPAADGFQGRFSIFTTSLSDDTIVRICTNNHGDQGAECTRGGDGSFRALIEGVVAGDRVLVAAVDMEEGVHTIYAEAVVEGAVELPSSPDRSVTVDSIRPTISAMTIVSGNHLDGFLNIADDEDADRAGMQVTVQLTLGQGAGGAANGQPVTIYTATPNPQDPTEIGEGTVQGGQAQVIVNIADEYHGSIYAVAEDLAGNTSLSPKADARNVGLPAVTVDTVAPTLSISAPEADEVLNSADDADPAAGLQFDAVFRVGGATSLAVTVDNEADDGSPINNPTGFEELRISLEGNQGDAHTIAATATDAAGNPTSRSVTVTAAPDRPTIAITSPEQGDVFGEEDDLNDDADQIQVDVVVSAAAGLVGRTVTVTSSLTLGRVDDGAVALDDNGNATVRCSLPPGVHGLSASVTDIYDNTGASASVEVSVQAVGCGLVIASPSGNPAYVGSTTIAVRVTAAVADCNRETVNLYIGDGVDSVGSGALVAGEITLADVPLGDGDGDRSLVARVVQNAGEGNESISQVSKTVRVDTLAPTVAFTDPAPPGGGGALQFAADVDPQAGLQQDFSFTVTGAEGSTLILESDISGELARLADLSAAGTQALVDVTVPDGTHTLTARVVDLAANDGEDELQMVVDTVPPGDPNDLALVINDLRRMSITLNWTATGDDGGTGGAVAAWQIRYAQTCIDTDEKFDAACDPGVVAAPLDPDGEVTAQTLSWTGPGPNGDCRFRLGANAADGSYYIALRAVDDLGNTSGVVKVDADAANDPGTCGGADPIVSTFTRTVIPAPAGLAAWGKFVRGLGDINGDGYADLGVGIKSANKAYIVYGAQDPADAVTQELPQDGTRLLGRGFASIGDVNGDGLRDVALLDFFTLWIYAGVAGGGLISTTAIAEFAMPAGGAHKIHAVDTAGNFDGDSTGGNPDRPLNDILVSAATMDAASGGAFIIRGREAWPDDPVELGLEDDDDAANLANGLIRFVGNTPGVYLGLTLGYAGSGGPLVDHDNDADTPPVPDAYGDVIVATNLHDGGLGIAYLIRGRPFGDVANHLSVGSPNVIRIDPIRVDSNGGFGGKLTRGGFDLNGDGYEDFVIPAVFHNRVEVFSGATAAHLQTLFGPQKFGWDMGFADIDNDGLADGFIGSNPDGDGEIQLVLQAAGGLLDGDPIFTGANLFGSAVDSAGDFNGDGNEDLVIGSPNENQVVVLH